MMNSNTKKKPTKCQSISDVRRGTPGASHLPIELGGFNEQVHYAEDYLLSKQVARNKFGIVRGGVYTTNRRFQKMGHFGAARLFLKTAFNSWNQRYFLRDHKYWA